jgi:hypothetical protein
MNKNENENEKKEKKKKGKTRRRKNKSVLYINRQRDEEIDYVKINDIKNGSEKHSMFALHYCYTI